MSDENARSPMTREERWLALALEPNRITYLPGSWDKRFARSLAEKARQDDATLSARQRDQMHRMAHRYRRQLGIAASRDAYQLPLRRAE